MNYEINFSIIGRHELNKDRLQKSISEGTIEILHYGIKIIRVPEDINFVIIDNKCCAGEITSCSFEGFKETVELFKSFVRSHTDEYNENKIIVNIHEITVSGINETEELEKICNGLENCPEIKP